MDLHSVVRVIAYGAGAWVAACSLTAAAYVWVRTKVIGRG